MIAFYLPWPIGASKSKIGCAAGIKPAVTDTNMAGASLTPTDAATAPLEVEKQLARLGREQFKLNTLLETQQQQFQAALQHLREQEERHKQDLADIQARRLAEQAGARLQVVDRLLPVVDGLEEALLAGQRLLEDMPSFDAGHRQRKESAAKGNAKPWWANILGWLLLFGELLSSRLPHRRAILRGHEKEVANVGATLCGCPESSSNDFSRLGGWKATEVATTSREIVAPERERADLDSWREAYVAWLHGLQLLRERLLETLAREGVYPIKSYGQVFDPRFHVAVGATPARPDMPPGSIVAVLRQGYMVGERVLRYAEVIAARADPLNPLPLGE